MKRKVIPVLVALLVAAAPVIADAQSSAKKEKTTKKEDYSRSEKVVLRLDDDGKTEIKINDGKITVDGEEVMTIADATNGKTEKTIIIEGNASRDGASDPFSFFGEGRSTGMQKAVLGVQVDSRDKEESGALVSSVSAKSAAEKAGLKAGDRITQVDDTKISNGSDLVEAISTYKPGEEVIVSYRRGKANATVKTELGKAPQQSRSYSRSFGTGPGGRMESDGGEGNGMNPFSFDFPQDFGNMFNESAKGPKLGITGEDLAEGDGVVVKDISGDSPAEKAGLRKGDVVVGFGGRTISSLSDLRAGVGEAKPGDTEAITYRRDGVKQTGKVSFPRKLRQEQL